MNSKSEKSHRLNSEIRVREVRLIDADGGQAGVVPILEALQKAEEAQLDLVEISPNAAPPVCRIMNYGKYLYEQSKQKAAQKKKSTVVETKEVKFSSRTGEGDIEVKLRNLRRFLEQGNKAKVTLRFRGREITHIDIGMKLMQRLRAELEADGIVEQHPRLEGRQIVMIIAPKRSKQ